MFLLEVALVFEQDEEISSAAERKEVAILSVSPRGLWELEGG